MNLLRQRSETTANGRVLWGATRDRASHSEDVSAVRERSSRVTSALRCEHTDIDDGGCADCASQPSGLEALELVQCPKHATFEGALVARQPWSRLLLRSAEHGTVEHAPRTTEMTRALKGEPEDDVFRFTHDSPTGETRHVLGFRLWPSAGSRGHR